MNRNEQNEEFSGQENSYETSSNAKKKLKTAHSRNTFIIICIVVLVLGFTRYQSWSKEANLTYIDGNVLKIARTGSASVGNPWKNASFVGQLAFRSLFMTDSGFSEINPELAEKFTVSEDGLSYVITMKSDQKWSDGQDLTAEDVVYSIESFLLCSGTNTTIAAAFNKIVGAEAWQNGETDSLEGISYSGNEIFIELTDPHTSFALVLTQFPPLPKHILQDEDPSTFTSGIEFFTDPVCSGMFMLDFVNEDGDMELIHNPYYSDKQTEIERVIMYGDYKNMHIDHYSTTNITEMVSYRSMLGFQEYGVNVYFYRYFVFNLMAEYELPELIPLVDENGVVLTDGEGQILYTESTEAIEYPEDREVNSAMQDVRVRQAITHAIDIKSCFEDVYFEQGQLTYGGSISLAEEVYEYNPSKAIALLEEAEYDFERPFTIAYYHTDKNTLVFLERVQSYLEDIGLTVRLVQSSSANLYNGREYDMFLKALSAFNTQDWYSEYLSSNTNLNAVMGTDEFDELVENLSASSDVPHMLEILGDLVELEQDLMYKIPLFSLSDSVYINSNRVSVPADMSFGNTRYRSDHRIDEWFIKKE